MDEDDSVKLREELEYTTFYPNLNDTLLIKTYFNPSQPAEQEETIDGATEVKGHTLVPVKQLLYQNTLKIEELTNLPSVDLQPWQLESFAKAEKQNNDELSFEDMAACVQEFYPKLSKTRMSFDSSYDLDTQDFFYLQYLRELGFPVSCNLMEILMTVAEIEWYNFEKYIPQKVSDLLNQAFLPQWFIDQYGTDDGRLATEDHCNEQRCAICNFSDSDPENSIVFCDGCNIAVHQECYGVVFIPEGSWYCRKCMVTGMNNTSISCKFCPSTSGAFKQTTTGDWAHVLCGLWIPELSFANINYMEPIINQENIPKSRWRLTCFICNKRNHGCCIQCVNKNCFTAYHPTCAKRCGLFLNLKSHSSIKEASTGVFKEGSFLETYCPKHQPYDWNDCTVGIAKARNYYSREIDVKKQLELARKQNVLENPILKLKTSSGTPVAPPYFINILSQLIALFILDKDEEFCKLLSFLLCKYWAMKKKFNNGTCLLKNWKFPYYATKSFDTEELDKQTSFMENVLLPDLNSMVAISELMKQRETLRTHLEKHSKIVEDAGSEFTPDFQRKKYLLGKLESNQRWQQLLSIPALSEYFDHFCNDTSFTDLTQFRLECSEIFKDSLNDVAYAKLHGDISKFRKTWHLYINKILAMKDF
ncbi:hypothetical protein ACO0QE_004191 [Hanseniaspora vineae]